MKPVNMNYEYLEIPGDLPIKERNYFKVVAKCGHVGKGYYFEGKFYVMAPTATRAAEKTRKFPRVKHDYKDAIISVESISYQEYLEGQNYEYNRPYYNCLSKQEQLMNWDDICQDIHFEDSYYREEKKKSKKHSLKNTYNYDPMYQELKRYRGNISAIDVA